ncbi:MAG: type VI secretion system contractile sheath small subunit [Bacteroidia bacterium]|nr:type VI secretion system contractile sheath small subunit [Bacteroidia bacterium]
MQTYGIGGQEVKGDASEAILEIPQNRTLFAQKLTSDAPVKPQIVEGLKNTDEVFAHYKPKVAVDFEDTSGAGFQEELRFGGLSDFGIKGITAQSSFLKNLNLEREQFQKIIKQLKTNKLLRKSLENPETRQAVLNSLYSMIKELEEAK